MSVRCGARRLRRCAASSPACGGDDDDPADAPVLVEQIAPAVAAVEAELGGPQQYFEVNATPQLVNLFVADRRRRRRSRRTCTSAASSPRPPSRRRAEGATFGADALTFDPATVLDGVADELPDCRA